MSAAGAASHPLVHGTAISVRGCAALLRGPSGSGKSDLALRCLSQPIHHGDRLIASKLVGDDQLRAELVDDGQIWLSSPESIRGRIEIRGLGIWRWPAIDRARLVALIDLVSPRHVERLPEPETTDVLGVAIPRIRLAPFEASAPAKLLLLLDRLADGKPLDHDTA